MVILPHRWRWSVDWLMTEEMLRVAVLVFLPVVSYFKGPHRVLIVNIGKSFPLGLAEGTEEWSLWNILKAFSITHKLPLKARTLLRPSSNWGKKILPSPVTSSFPVSSKGKKKQSKRKQIKKTKQTTKHSQQGFVSRK